MNNNELRLGNLIDTKCLGKQTPYKVGVLDFANKTCEQWIGIPLTEEWIEKLGFERNAWIKTKIRFEYWHPYLSISRHVESGKKWDTTWFLDGYKYREPIKYVHQLQNLYFALTGVELQLSST